MSDLTGINAAKDVQITALKKSLAIAQDMNAAAAKQIRRNKGKATRKAIGWILGAGAFAYVLGSAER